MSRVTSLPSLREGYLSPLDDHFARALGRIGGESRPEVLLAVALASRLVRDGHVCLDLRRFAADPRRQDDGEAVAKTLPEVGEWLDALRRSPLVSTAESGGDRPLVLDAHGRLYLRRYWEHEAAVVDAIRRRVAARDEDIDAAWLRTALDRLFPHQGVGPAGPQWQRVAAVVALQRSFCVISGGPGTGKTFTVAKILALLVEKALRAGARAPRVALVAPTGKAAARLAESIRRTKADLRVEPATLALVPEEASTIHRCLGTFRGTTTAFVHNRENPLAADVVLVDEASMVDVALLRRLFDALLPHARVILLGDKDQLASVEAGAVLGDICNSGRPVAFSRQWAERLQELTGEPLPSGDGAPERSGIWDCIVQLRHSYRSAAAPAIGALAAAINAGDAGEVLDLLDSAGPTVERCEPVPDGALGAALSGQVVEGFGEYLRREEPAEQLRHLDHFRVLCAHRRGPRGALAINSLAEKALHDAGLIEARGTMYAGRPVLITENDYHVDLFNGDVGVIGPDSDRPAALLAFFAGSGGRLRRLSPSRLPPHETAYAISVHKSQGSELDRVAVVLPEELSPVLSRELLYTAVTRAREAVAVHASREIIRQTVARRVERSSGLRDALWPAGEFET